VPTLDEIASAGLEEAGLLRQKKFDVAELRDTLRFFFATDEHGEIDDEEWRQHLADLSAGPNDFCARCRGLADAIYDLETQHESDLSPTDQTRRKNALSELRAEFQGHECQNRHVFDVVQFYESLQPREEWQECPDLNEFMEDALSMLSQHDREQLDARAHRFFAESELLNRKKDHLGLVVPDFENVGSDVSFISSIKPGQIEKALVSPDGIPSLDELKHLIETADLEPVCGPCHSLSTSRLSCVISGCRHISR